MAEPKTTPTTASVKAFLDRTVKDPALRADCDAVSALKRLVQRSIAHLTKTYGAAR